MSNIITAKKNDVEFFEAVREAYVDKDRVKGQKVCAAIQAFLHKPKQIVKKKIQAVSVSTDFAQLTKDAFNVTIAQDNFDLGYERVFMNVPLAPGQDSWEIYNVTEGLTFRKIPEGGRVRVEGVAGSKVTAHVDSYAGALGWTDQMIRYRKVAAMVSMATIFRNNFWLNKANVYYTLLGTGASGNVTTYQGAAADGQLQRDIQTINSAAFTLTDRLKNKGYTADAANARLVMYANPSDRSRIQAAFAATTAVLAAAGRTGDTIGWNIDVIYTYNSAVTAGSPILIFPGGQIQSASDLPPTTFNQPQDALTLNSLQAVWAIYGAVVADTDQCQQLTLS
jgi:hypothetical protein